MWVVGVLGLERAELAKPREVEQLLGRPEASQHNLQVLLHVNHTKLG